MCDVFTSFSDIDQVFTDQADQDQYVHCVISEADGGSHEMHI